MRILSIETSCDETSIAVLQVEKDGGFSILTNIVSSQVAIHAPYGGVVPTLAKREHQKNLVPILKRSLVEAGLFKIQNSKIPGLARAWPRAGKNQNDADSIAHSRQSRNNSKFETLREILDREEVLYKNLLPFLKKHIKPKIDLIAVTNGPGLEPALWVGVNFAKALALAWDLPIVPVNHVEAHIIANWLSLPQFNAPYPPLKIREGEGELFPIISLIVSGGHSQLVLMRGFRKYKILGETRDDAAGEAFDKLAKMLNLGYPGGPAISQLVEKCKSQNTNYKIPTNRKTQITNIKFPRPMINSGDYDFSFSGLKTAALYFVKTLDKKTLKKLTPAICTEFQQAAIDVLVSKTIRAAKEFGAKTILLSGGVASNDLLRETLKHETEKLKFPTPSLPFSKGGRAQGGGSVKFSVPPKEFCTDNAAMIALTAAFAKKKAINWDKISVDSNLRLK